MFLVAPELETIARSQSQNICAEFHESLAYSDSIRNCYQA